MIAREFEISGFPEAAEFAQAALKAGKLLILLDGLDEVPTEQVYRAITQIQDLVDRHSKNRFIASCRVAAYKGGFGRFRDVAMAAFDDEQIQDFIYNWFRSTRDQDRETAKQCWELLQRPEYSAAKDLAQTPLLLTLLCAVYDKSLDFPKNRSSLYGEALDVLLKEWAAEKRIHNEPIYRELPLELERELLAEVAYASFKEDQLFFSKRDVTKQIKQFLIGNLNAPKHLDSEKVLEAIAIQQGILVERARDTYSFSHLTFQEYLTAQHIVDNQELEWLISNHLSNDRWREVFLLTAGLISGRKGADGLLLQMQTRTNTFIQTNRLSTLLTWAETVTASSKDQYNCAAKRAAAIYFTLDLDIGRARTRSRAHARTLARALDRTRALDCLLDLDRALDLPLALDMDRAFDLDRNLEKIKILGISDFEDYVAQLEAMRGEVPNDNQPIEVRQAFAEKIWQLWFEKLWFESGVAMLSEEEVNILERYLYANELMVRCKEAAVRVSPEVWAGIEARMLTVGESGE